MTFIYPLDDPYLTRGFFYQSTIYVGGMHAASDYAAPAGTPIRAVADGLVVGVGWDFYSGFFVAIDHDGGWRSTYRHLFAQAPVSVGQRVVQGQVIGNVGNTGWSLGNHLHFDLWNLSKVCNDAFYKNGWWACDPELYLGKEDDMGMTQAETEWVEKLQARIYALEAHADDTKYHHNPDEIRDIVGDGDGYTDARAVKAVKDALPG